jgi:hypothetical protein
MQRMERKPARFLRDYPLECNRKSLAHRYATSALTYGSDTSDDFRGRIR